MNGILAEVHLPEFFKTTNRLGKYRDLVVSQVKLSQLRELTDCVRQIAKLIVTESQFDQALHFAYRLGQDLEAVLTKV
ncbi:hypothetical protein ACPOL_0392 [Acidisarcina polymorpha]|uniref:Uncharacterized protein n=1 Tax=Acidisarcina polymorpha TaxID=2211140 RepID=A0A2Z5FSF4_9BACT|nr:hypothetical protein ACPOL_0392 [Acidisarcina polymorpha]